MSFELLGLGKLLNAMYSSNSQRITLLRSDIRSEIKKAEGFGNSTGGDFYGPFWSDAKRHVAGDLDLRLATIARIESNKGRERLYTNLRDGFLLWWEEKRRLRNVPFSVIPGNIKSRYEIEGAGTVKVENTLSITVGDTGHRIIYPYFCEDPDLCDEAARLGLWLMSKCIKGYSPQDMRLLDIIKSQSFSTLDTPLLGNEEKLFVEKYKALISQWNGLRAEYV